MTASLRHDAHVSAATRALQRRASDLIPGGAHTYAKGDDQYPAIAPPFIARGAGCHVWDLDGNEFIEYGMGLRAVTLGHAHPAVAEAAYRAMLQGTNFTRPSPLEVEAAEAFLALLPAADMIKFCKNGSDATTAAVKLARAHTGRDIVAICTDHPFFSTDDWFIGTTPVSAGIPQAIRSLTVGFHYNDLESLRACFAAHPGHIACVVMEAETWMAPAEGYLHAVQQLCRDEGALFILDEMITGFRWDLGGAQRVHGLTPDLSTFGKAMANGIALSALAGRREIMELGGLRHNRERVFLLSTTHGAESHALAAGLATLKVYREQGVIEILHRQGERLRRGVNEVAHRHGLAAQVQAIGRASNLVFTTRDRDGLPSQGLRTLFLQELIRHGILGPSFVISQAHGDVVVDQTIEAVDAACAVYARALTDGVAGFLVGEPTKTVYRTHN
jgi:glutamate-1-semialdehyde 2,1-aminomutase